MKRLIAAGIFFLIVLLNVLPQAVYAQRYASCDQCGLCATSTSNITALPSNWKSCAACLYPDIPNTQPESLKTLEIVRVTEGALVQDVPHPPAKGHFYTGIGCFTTNLADFTQPGAAAALTQPLLNVLFSLGGGVAFLYLLYGAFLVVTSRGDPQQLSQGRRTIYGAIIGIVFAMSAVFLINVIASGVLKIPGFQ